jgi:hypothetical protein
MVFNPSFNNISAISLPSVLLVEETGEPRENNQSLVEKYCVSYIQMTRDGIGI